MADIAEVLDIEGLANLEEPTDHFMAVSIVRGQERDLLAEFRECVATDCADVRCGFKASWNVKRLKSAASLMASDWLIELKITPRSLVTLLIPSCTAAERLPTTKFTFSFSTSSSVRVAASPGLSLSSRTTSSALRPLRPPASLN